MGLIGGPGWYRSCPVQQTKKVPHGAEFKDILQMGQLKDLLDLLCDIHQLKHACAGTSPLPHVQQHPQAACIDAVNRRQVKH
jgi:hypothetical protein